MSRMMKIFKTLREENENVVKLKGICADGMLPKYLLLEGKEALENELIDKLQMFNNAKNLDKGEGIPMDNQAAAAKKLFTSSTPTPGEKIASSSQP